MIKNIIMTTCIIGGLMSIVSMGRTISHQYQLQATCITASNDLDCNVQDINGNIWYLDGYTFRPSEPVILIIDDNGTSNDSWDDIVIDAYPAIQQDLQGRYIRPFLHVIFMD